MAELTKIVVEVTGLDAVKKMFDFIKEISEYKENNSSKYLRLKAKKLINEIKNINE